MCQQPFLIAHLLTLVTLVGIKDYSTRHWIHLERQMRQLGTLKDPIRQTTPGKRGCGLTNQSFAIHLRIEGQIGFDITSRPPSPLWPSQH